MPSLYTLRNSVYARRGETKLPAPLAANTKGSIVIAVANKRVDDDTALALALLYAPLFARERKALMLDFTFDDVRTARFAVGVNCPQLEYTPDSELVNLMASTSEHGYAARALNVSRALWIDYFNAKIEDNDAGTVAEEMFHDTISMFVADPTRFVTCFVAAPDTVRTGESDGQWLYEQAQKVARACEAVMQMANTTCMRVRVERKLFIRTQVTLRDAAERKALYAVIEHGDLALAAWKHNMCVPYVLVEDTRAACYLAYARPDAPKPFPVREVTDTNAAVMFTDTATGLAYVNSEEDFARWLGIVPKFEAATQPPRAKRGGRAAAASAPKRQAQAPPATEETAAEEAAAEPVPLVTEPEASTDALPVNSLQRAKELLAESTQHIARFRDLGKQSPTPPPPVTTTTVDDIDLDDF